jgi:hypothetical protein
VGVGDPLVCVIDHEIAQLAGKYLANDVPNEHWHVAC